MKQAVTVSEFLKAIRENFSHPKAINSYTHQEWVSLSTKEYTDQVKYLALALVQMGVKKGDRIGIIAQPSGRWAIADLAIMVAGAVSVPLFANISEENFYYEIQQAELKIVFIGGQEQWQRYEDSKDLFKLAIGLEDSLEIERVLSFDAVLASGKKADEAFPDLYERLESAIRPGDLATIIYTSGSTGVPKGAEHTHFSLFSLLHVDLFKWDGQNDRYLSILPLAHVFGRVLNFITLYWGISTYYYNDLKNLSQACKELHPTILVVVPRLLEKVYAKMVAKVQEAGYMQRAIGQWAFDLANQEEETFWKQLFHPVAEKLVYSSLLDALGSHLRVVICGGAALSPQLCHFFRDIGVPLYEGWGLTEACPITVNQPDRVKIGTIGIPIGNLEVKLSEEKELLVRGSNVMRGYYKNPGATAEAIDSEGWLSTGDRGEVDEEGFVSIIGRSKELFKTSTGEAIAPVPIEHALCKAPFIDMALVVADKRKFASALLFPNFEILKVLKVHQNQAHLSDEEFLKSIYIKDEMEKLLNRVNSHLNHWEQIHAYRFITHHLSVEEGDLTPSMKIRRDVVEQKFKEMINAMYEKEQEL
ncbi:putative long-chain-fatty-acid--CoA ligase [Chlamydiales bacterium STE3]|nr:putative long-chain-fatty-acid--CoA ligase [Chlamydiales bacterium STE3]